MTTYVFKHKETQIMINYKVTKISILLSALLGGACGSESSVDNVESCESFVDSLKCGDSDISKLYPANFCGSFSQTSCDISEYFDCLTANTQCVLDDAILGDHLDNSGTLSCANKAKCE